MRNFKFYLLLFAALTFPSTVSAADIADIVKEQNAALKSALIKFDGNGLTPKNLVIDDGTSLVILLNDSKDSDVTLSLDFKKKALHCHSDTLKQDENGVLHSVKPFGPKDFATFCFHEKGKYDLKVFGSNIYQQGLDAIIEVR